VYYGSMAARLLAGLVSFYSPTFLERDAASWLVEEAWRMGFHEAFLDGAGNVRLIVYPEEGGWSPGDRVALVSHIDTVPGWVEPVYNGDLVRSRGAVDAKAPLSAMVVAAAHYRPRHRPVEVVAAVGEEGPSHGAWHLVETGWRASAVVIGEPTNTFKVAIGYRGGCRLSVECLGESGHSSSPGLYTSACSLAVKAYHILEEASSPRVDGYSLAVTRMECGSGGNVVAEEARLVVDARIPVGGSVEELLGMLRSRLPPQFSVAKTGRCLPPVKVSVSSPAARALIRGLLRQGYRAQPVIKAGTSDMNILYRVAGSIAAYGPGRSELSHTRAEETTAWELEVAVRTYLAALEELDRPIQRSGRR
jgi:LysW-gamma-L-lysine carboxypeptidase